LLIVPILKLIKTVLSAWYYYLAENAFTTFIFFLSQYVNELFPYGIVENNGVSLTSAQRSAS
jgi:hypothetical protein